MSRLLRLGDIAPTLDAKFENQATWSLGRPQSW